MAQRKVRWSVRRVKSSKYFSSKKPNPRSLKGQAYSEGEQIGKTIASNIFSLLG